MTSKVKREELASAKLEVDGCVSLGEIIQSGEQVCELSVKKLNGIFFFVGGE